jgi:hypothetical protein
MSAFKEYLAESKLVPDSISKPMTTNELMNTIGKTRTKALLNHPYIQKHFGSHESLGMPLVHKVLVDKYGYPEVMTSSAFTYTNPHGQKTRKMVRTSLSKNADSKVHQIHLFHNYDNERHRENEGGGPLWRYRESLHNDE